MILEYSLSRQGFVTVLCSSLSVTQKPNPVANAAVMTTGCSGVAIMKAFICGWRGEKQVGGETLVHDGSHGIYTTWRQIKSRAHRAS